MNNAVLYDEDGNLLSEEERQKKIKLFKNEINFINNISIQPNTKPKLLDLGCGPGFLSSAIRNEFEKYGLEVSKNIADFAKKYIKNVHIGPLTNDTYPEEFFDIILCSHVIEHIEDPFDFIKNIRTILKTHGYLVIGTPNFNSGAAIRFGENYRLLHDRTHISLFDDFGLNNFLEDFGFYIEKIDYPFFDTEYFTMENFERLFDTSKMSPSFYGNLMTFYTQKK